MKVAVYSGNFNPWHVGHLSIYKQAIRVFDRVLIGSPKILVSSLTECSDLPTDAEFMHYDGLLIDAINRFNSQNSGQGGISAVVRGLRSGYNLGYAQNMQYWAEDLHLSVPVVYFIADRLVAHISSKQIRGLRELVGGLGDDFG